MQIFCFCERNSKGALVNIQKSRTIADLKASIEQRHGEMGSDWRDTSLLLGGQAHTVVRGDGPALSQTVDIATGRAIGFAGSKYMATQLLPGPLNPGVEGKKMVIIFQGHVMNNDKTLAECGMVDGCTVRVDV